MPDVCTYFGVRMTLKYKIRAFQRRVPIVLIPLRFVSSAPQSWLAKVGVLMSQAVGLLQRDMKLKLIIMLLTAHLFHLRSPVRN